MPIFAALPAGARQPGLLNGILGNLQSGAAQQQAAQAAQQQAVEVARQQAAANATAAWNSIDPQVYRCLSTTMSPPPAALAGGGISPGDYRVQLYIQRCVEGIAQTQAQNAAAQRAAAEEAERQQLARAEASARTRQQQPTNPPAPALETAAVAPADAFLNPALFTQTEVQLVQDALIWTGNYVGLKDGVWGKGTVDSVRNWRRANNLQPAVSLRPAEMTSLLTQAATAKNALNWTGIASVVVVEIC